MSQQNSVQTKSLRLLAFAAILATVIIGLVFVFATRKSSQPQDGGSDDASILARVGDRAITIADFERERERLGSKPVDNAAVLEDLIQRQAFLIAAEARNLQSSPEVVRQYENLLIGRLRKELLQPQLDEILIEDSQVESYYNANKLAFSTPPKVRLAMLMRSIDTKTSEEQRKQIESELREARDLATELPKNARGFGALAIRHSEDAATRYKGGDLGWFEEGQATRWESIITDYGFANCEKTGSISDVLVGEDGLYLVMVLDHRPASIRPLAEVNPRLRHRLIREAQVEAERTFNASALAAVPVDRYLERLPSQPAAAPPDQHGQAPLIP